MNVELVIVDDDPEILWVMALTFREEYPLRCFTTGLEAIQYLSTASGPYLLVTDGQMPQMDGMSLLDRALRTRGIIGAILITGNPKLSEEGRKTLLPRFQAAGIPLHFFEKPCLPKEIQSTLNAIVHRAPPSSDA